MIRRLRDYADERALPISEGCVVHRVGPESGGYAIDSSRGLIHAQAVVVATGEYRRARLPRAPFAPAAGLTVLHSSDYRSPGQLPRARCWSSAAANPAHRSPRTCATLVAAYWSLADRHSHTRRLRGKDSMTWWDMAGRIHQHVSQSAAVLAGEPDALRKAAPRSSPDFRQGRRRPGQFDQPAGDAPRRIRLLGRLQEFNGNTARFADVRPQLRTAIEATRAEYAYLDSLASAYYATRPEPRTDDARYIPEEVYLHWEPDIAPDELDLQAAGIRSVVLATGFVAEWPWLDVQARWMPTAIRWASLAFPATGLVLHRHAQPAADEFVVPATAAAMHATCCRPS